MEGPEYTFLYIPIQERCINPQNYSLQVFLNGWNFKTLTIGKITPNILP